MYRRTFDFLESQLVKTIYVGLTIQYKRLSGKPTTYLSELFVLNKSQSKCFNNRSFYRKSDCL